MTIALHDLGGGGPGNGSKRVGIDGMGEAEAPALIERLAH